MAKVRYECTTPPHNKWWEIEYDEDMLGYTTWWGKIGCTPSGFKEKRFQSKWRCEAAYGNKVNEKLSKGYRLISKGRGPIKSGEEKKEPERNQFDVFGKM